MSRFEKGHAKGGVFLFEASDRFSKSSGYDEISYLDTNSSLIFFKENAMLE